MSRHTSRRLESLGMMVPAVTGDDQGALSLAAAARPTVRGRRRRRARPSVRRPLQLHALEGEEKPQ